MLIRLSKEQQERLLAWSGKITSAHHNEDAMAPGYELIITFSMVGAEAWPVPERLNWNWVMWK